MGLRAKRAAKSKTAKKTAPVLGAAGLSLALAGTAAATTSDPATRMPPGPDRAPNHEIILGEEEISDVSLATFYVFDKQSPRTGEGRVQTAGGPLVPLHIGIREEDEPREEGHKPDETPGRIRESV